MQHTVSILDGGLATELERRGFDLAHRLWSARLLAEDPEAIAAVHRSYLEAGADILTSAGYQASIPGFLEAGFSRAEAEDLLREPLRLAARVRDQAEGDRPLVAASIGPYGAYLADGSEYRGHYAASPDELERFHRGRLEVVLDEMRSGSADLLLCETIPSSAEALLLARLLEELGAERVWISLCCRDGYHTAEGQSVEELARDLSRFEPVESIGVNCVAPAHVSDLLRALRRGTNLPLLAYPNAGETFDPESKRWVRGPGPPDLAAGAQAWCELGARVIGGCCRTGPAEIRALAVSRR